MEGDHRYDGDVRKQLGEHDVRAERSDDGFGEENRDGATEMTGECTARLDVRAEFCGDAGDDN